MYPAGERRFLAINFITIVSLFALILAGGIVRSTGSGMGCPDWPKCFGSYVPPTDVSQLPNNYKEKFVAGRVAKNERFAKVLDLFGFADLASKVKNDKSILETESFNVSKTWTEYINRLIGAFTGFFLIGCLIASFTYLRKRSRIFFLSLLNLILVILQGWLGSIVVSTNLLAWVVTLHMLLALAIIAISIYTYFQAKMLRDRNLLTNRHAGALKKLALLILSILIVQIALGTEVREEIDAISSSMNYLNRSVWVSKTDWLIDWHRNGAVLILILNSVLFVLIRNRYPLTGLQFKYMASILLIMIIQIITGVVLSYLALPAIAQAAHIFLATVLFGAQFYLLLLLKTNKTYARTRK